MSGGVSSTESSTDTSDVNEDDATPTAIEIAQSITGFKFANWYDDYEYRQNIENGQHFFNGPAALKPPGKFTASQLLKCQRKTYYNHLNAPEENDDPDGIFYFGSVFEEDIIEKFFKDAVASENTYIRNSLWISLTLDSELGDMKLTGATDPVVVDEQGAPILLTEIKTTSSIDYLDEPKRHHKAQAHAYMQGLSEKWEREIDHALILYAERDSLDVTTFHVPFDEDFWKDIVQWMKTNTYYRMFGKLPPATPEQSWECEYCDYKNRCGEGEEFYGGENALGFLPVFEYPRDKVEEYLEAHEDAKLMPALANQHPDLANEYRVFDWECDACEETYAWDEVPYSTGEKPPKCPNCRPDNEYLAGPSPIEQHPDEVTQGYGKV